jgi:tRNA A37 threonylcarbamoyladenosine synthetase subunit TsaC/SUA5/YrdC
MNPDQLILIQSDTTVGFHSHSSTQLNRTKQRPNNKPFLSLCSSLSQLTQRERVPNKYKSRVRRSKQSTFIYPSGYAYRVSFDATFNRLITPYNPPLLSSSANLSGETFDYEWAVTQADIVINPSKLDNRQSSKIYKFNNFRIIRIR